MDNLEWVDGLSHNKVTMLPEFNAGSVMGEFNQAQVSPTRYHYAISYEARTTGDRASAAKLLKRCLYKELINDLDDLHDLIMSGCNAEQAMAKVRNVRGKYT